MPLSVCMSFAVIVLQDAACSNNAHRIVVHAALGHAAVQMHSVFVLPISWHANDPPPAWVKITTLYVCMCVYVKAVYLFHIVNK